jgi:hypothetical protein
LTPENGAKVFAIMENADIRSACAPREASA